MPFFYSSKFRPQLTLDKKLGRGIDFFQEVFGWSPLPSYRLGLQLMFHLRNVTVHNNGIADDRLCQLAKNPHIECIGKLKVRDKVSWNLGTVLQLQHLVIATLSEVDPYIAQKLELPILKKQAFWHEDNSLDSLKYTASQIFGSVSEIKFVLN